MAALFCLLRSPRPATAMASGGGPVSADGDTPVFLPNFADEEVRALNDLVIQSQKDLLHVEVSTSRRGR